VGGDAGTITRTTTRTTTGEGQVGSQFLQLNDLLGLTVQGADGQSLGTIGNLIFDSQTGQIAFFTLEGGVASGLNGQMPLIPFQLGTLTLGANGPVLTTQLTAERLQAAPTISSGAGVQFDGSAAAFNEALQFYQGDLLQARMMQQQRALPNQAQGNAFGLQNNPNAQAPNAIPGSVSGQVGAQGQTGVRGQTGTAIDPRVLRPNAQNQTSVQTPGANVNGNPTGTISGRQGTISGQQGTISGRQGTISGQQGTISGQQNTTGSGTATGGANVNGAGANAGGTATGGASTSGATGSAGGSASGSASGGTN
jgi:hypothetical protein